ncbi:MAG: TspO/MBR family protein [Candidatus Diapherotrites archaeon]
MRWLKLLLSIFLCQLTGIIGAFFTYPKIFTWYSTIKKPSFVPPNWLFGPVWITLYTLMGIALYLFLESNIEKRKKDLALALFFVQLFLNAFWSFVFFGLESPFLGLVCIITLWVSIVFTMFSFYKKAPKSAYLLLPYLVWVTFAMVLNYNIWVLNS